MVLQMRREADPRYLIGHGKLDELNLKAMQMGADAAHLRQELSPSQARHIGEATSLKVLDRTQLILDIFAQRAQSADGKLQVELAQLKYLLARGWCTPTARSRAWRAASAGAAPARRSWRSTAAGCATASPSWSAESTSSRRTARCGGRRATAPGCRSSPSSATPTRASRRCSTRSPSPTVLAEDRLFATLDPTSRRLRFPREREVIITDTVGFIRDLPKDLVNAFRATLEELLDASLLLHVIDAADPQRDEQVQAVERILKGLELDTRPRLLVWNKADLLSPIEAMALVRVRGGVAISAARREGLDLLLEKAERTLFAESGSEKLAVLREPVPDEPIPDEPMADEAAEGEPVPTGAGEG